MLRPDTYVSPRQPRAKHSNTIDFCEDSIVSGMLSPLQLINARENGEGIVINLQVPNTKSALYKRAYF
ncbi:MAG: hypothetical protein F6J93_06550 [Oscillatoria sp. SIO1A7]|nr:hypothetical protein [Oscillatoria sp. SIO1A7]